MLRYAGDIAGAKPQCAVKLRGNGKIKAIGCLIPEQLGYLHDLVKRGIIRHSETPIPHGNKPLRPNRIGFKRLTDRREKGSNRRGEYCRDLERGKGIIEKRLGIDLGASAGRIAELHLLPIALYFIIACKKKLKRVKKTGNILEIKIDLLPEYNIFTLGKRL